jgi:hypothetical protein
MGHIGVTHGPFCTDGWCKDVVPSPECSKLDGAWHTYGLDASNGWFHHVTKGASKVSTDVASHVDASCNEVDSPSLR